MKNISTLLAILLTLANTTHAQSPESHLVAHWSFDRDSAGTVIDESGNGLHGQWESGVYGNGVFNKAALIDSASGGIHIPAKGIQAPAAIAGLEQGSISVWFKYMSIEGMMLPIIYMGESKEDAPHNSLIIEVGHGNNPFNRKLYFTIVNQRFCFDSNVDLSENEWHHFVAVVSDQGNTGYLDGKLMTDRHYNLGSDSTYHNFFTSVPSQDCLAIGYGRYGMDNRFFYFNGAIDEVRIYDAALSAQEAEALYREGATSLGILQPTRVHDSGEPTRVQDFELMGNYPNPFNPATSIRFRLQRETRVRIDVFAADGRHLRTLADSYLSAGEQNIKFDGQGLSSGVYMYRVQSSRQDKWGKFLLMK
ncbi:T9SS type A sorting domain-containing protein [candidate division KSB1 bacterium]|nr:T9SS type A sorting domain-containing protein [candidate division KSB1 bacterium]